MKKITKRILALLIAVTMLLGVAMPGITSDSFAPLFIEASAAGASPAITSQETYCNNNPSFSQCYQGIRLKWSAVSGASYYSLYIYQFDDFYSSSYTMNTLVFSINCSTNSFDSARLSEAKYLETKSIWQGGTLPGYYVLVIPRDSSGNSLCSSYTFTNLTSTVGIYFPHMLYFYTNDGTDTLFYKTSSMCHNGVTMSEWASLPTRKGYTLIGWSENKNSSTAEYSINDKFSCGHGDAYFYAVWSPISYTVKYNANGGTGAMSSSSHKYDEYKYLNTNSFSRSGYYFLGWSTSSSATSATYIDGQSVVNLTSTNGGVVNLYAVWSKIPTYTVSYNANGGTGAPSSQTKTKDETLWLSSVKPTKSYKITYNANGGSVSSSSKTVNCTFKNWNTAQNGSGTAYAAGAGYTTNANATLYAQWTNPTAGTLATPTRTDYTFDGWYTAATGGTKVTSSSTVSSNVTLYAHWTKVPEEDVYNLGEETYSFDNYGDSSSPGGHCFGMSATSAGYYNDYLDITKVGGTKAGDVYSLSFNDTVEAPICHYQKIQGYGTEYEAIVAGGNIDLYGSVDINSDWNECVNYVKSHKYDNKGSLNVGMWYANGGGHAVNFLYYKKVNGQDRIYVYDNNYPQFETYYYMGSDGYVHQGAEQANNVYNISIIGLDLMDVEEYFNLAEDFKFQRYVYADSESVSISNSRMCYMKCAPNSSEQVMYEIQNGSSRITITPNTENATFTYLDKEYKFTNKESGTFILADSKNGKVKHSNNIKLVETELKIRNYVATQTVGYKTTITFTADVVKPVDGEEIIWYINGKEAGVGSTLTVNQVTDDFTVQCKTTDSSGNIVESEIEEVKVKSGFFDKFIAFFKGLFGLLPYIEQ